MGLLTPSPLAVALGLAFAVLTVRFFALRLLLAQGFGQHTCVMLGVLRIGFDQHPITSKLRIAVQLVVLVDDLLRRTAHFAFGARAIENAVYDIGA
jgi:hypothetical protein